MSQPLQRIAVVGAGAIGAVCAAALQRAGQHNVVLCARHRPAAPIVVEHSGFPPLTLTAPVLCNPSELCGPADFVFLAVKAHQTESARGWCQVLCRHTTIVAILQNGVEHVERVSPFTDGAILLPVVVHCNAVTVTPGRVRADTPMRLIVPAGDAARMCAALLTPGGVDVEPVHDFLTAQWEKLCLNALSALMAITGRPAEVFRSAELAQLARRLALECIRVGRACGARLDEHFAEEVLSTFQSMPRATGSSILADRLAGRPLEWEARNGVIQRLGAAHNIPTPVSDALVPLLAALSAGS